MVRLAWAFKKRSATPAVGLTLAVLPLTPALLFWSLNQGVENAFAERFAYLPSFGVVLVAGWGVAELVRCRAGLAGGLAAGLAAVVLLGGVATFQRTRVWKDSLSLWEDAAAKSPESGTANLNYGYALMNAGLADEGRRYSSRAVAQNQGIVRRETARAIDLAGQRRATEAILAFHRVLAMDPNSAEAHYNLGVLYEEQGQAAKPIGEYLAAVKLDATLADAHNNLDIL